MRNSLLLSFLFLFTASTLTFAVSVAGDEDTDGRSADDDTIESEYEAPEPFPDVYGHCSNCNPPRSASPDPLVRTTWSSTTNTSELQIYRLYHPAKHSVDPPNAISGLNSWMPNDHHEHLRDENHGKSTTTIQVHKTATLFLDWGVEVAGWLEFVSPNLAAHPNVTVRAGLSEFNTPYPGKTREVKQYGTSTFRLETNDELYEGVRFTWLYFEFPDDATTTTTTRNNDHTHHLLVPQQDQEPIHISNISLVAKVKPIQYAGSFESSDFVLDKVWYTGAYAVRLNMEANGFNSVLVERGDRVAIQGDGHPTMAASLVAFAPYNMIHKVLQETNSGHVNGHHVVDEYIMAYPLYWTLSCHDWFMASGDTKNFLQLLPDIRSIVDLRIRDFLSPDLDIVWMGWDDRLGNGWCFHKNKDQCPREAHLAFAALVIRACNDLARSLKLAGMADDAEIYQDSARKLSLKFRQVSEYPGGLDVHSATNAINAGLATQFEIEEWMKTLLNDPVTICSWSPFNQYWILQAFGNADQMEHALASIQLCWAPMTELGHGCFWELFSPEWPSLFESGDMMPTMPSYCHPWSSGVTAWMSHVLGGITALLPGYREFVAAPYVSEKYPSVLAEVPTPQGLIKVNATLGQEDDSTGVYVTMHLESPVPGYIGVSKLSNGRNNSLIDVRVDGVKVATKSAKDVALQLGAAGAQALGGHFHPSKASGLYFVRIDTGGSFNIKVRYGDNAESISSRKLPHIPPFPEPKYPATVTFDRTSFGDGIYEYGSDGYILFGHHENGTNLVALPSYIQRVSASQHGFLGWSTLNATYMGASNDNLSYLPNPRNRSEARKIGAIGQGKDVYWDPGMLIDIQLKGRNAQNSVLVDVEKKADAGGNPQPFVLSLYCLAADHGEDYAIRAMDLMTNSVIAPTTMISDYEGGVWWSLQYDRSVRLRLMSIHGLHISAVGFKSIKSDLGKATAR